ncbi:MAG TPA: alginate export family protein, partial [Geobacteraceae bacterium]|nr:alginate export family protein [Geobacteraceae bacterium]
TIEAYGLNDTGSTDHHGGEHRDIWGLRGTAKLGPVGFEFEPVYETGRVFNPNSGGNDNISAYGGHVDVSVESTLAGRRNQFLLSYALGSGDREAANDSRFRKEFRNPDNDHFLLGDMNVIGDFSGITVGDSHASGIQDFTFGWGIDITKELNFTATGHYFLANDVPDGFSKDLGLETDFILTYAINDNLSILCAYDHFFTGGFFRDATGSGGDIHYGYVMLQFDLSKAWPRVKKG